MHFFQANCDEDQLDKDYAKALADLNACKLTAFQKLSKEVKKYELQRTKRTLNSYKKKK